VLEQVRQATAVVVYSEYAREVAIRNGIDPRRCHVLPYFVSAAIDLRPPPGDGGVCFAGRLTKLKGPDLLLEAVARSRRVTHLEVVGDGYHREALTMLARRLGIASRVTFSGWLDAGATRLAMRAADLVAVPSIWPEPFGIVGLEAMASSRGVIASGSGGIPEWLKDNETGRIVGSLDPSIWATALDQAIENKPVVAAWGAAGARQVRRFSRERHLHDLKAIYAGITMQ
jgi:glycosyltransferase involved in cell wall biosynthesis